MSDELTRPLRPGAAQVQAEQQQLAPGDRVGDWIVVRRLGGGGFGNVYEAEHHRTKELGALKVLHAHFVASPEMLARFARETQVLARLQHPNVVKIVDTGFDAAGRPYLCMELLVGEDLDKVLRERGAMAPEMAQQIFEPLAEATAFAHELGIVHRDLKASNVFVTGDGRVVLLDFGIAKISDALAPELTASHQSLGTPGSMAPEQIHGTHVDARTDVYALGGLLFHMLTGKLPFHDPSPTMTQYLHLHARRPRASGVAPAVPARLDDVIVRAMAIEPGDRFESVPALLAALRAALRQSRFHNVVTTVDHVAILLAVGDRSSGAALDEALLADLEAVLPAAERFLGARGFSLVLDLGSSALFIAPAAAIGEPAQAALAAWDDLEQRSGRDPRVRVGMGVHRGPATVIGDRVEPSALLRPETWGIPDPLEGVWVTAAIEPAARRLR